MLDSTLHHSHRNIKWGNIFWQSYRSPFTRDPETCVQRPLQSGWSWEIHENIKNVLCYFTMSQNPLQNSWILIWLLLFTWHVDEVPNKTLVTCFWDDKRHHKHCLHDRGKYQAHCQRAFCGYLMLLLCLRTYISPPTHPPTHHTQLSLHLESLLPGLYTLTWLIWFLWVEMSDLQSVTFKTGCPAGLSQQTRQTVEDGS